MCDARRGIFQGPLDGAWGVAGYVFLCLGTLFFCLASERAIFLSWEHPSLEPF